MLDTVIAYTICGAYQLKQRRRLLGSLLLLSFSASVSFAVYGFLQPNDPRGLMIGATASLLALLILAYHFLDMREARGRKAEVEAEGDANEEELYIKPVAQQSVKVKSSGAVRKSTAQADAIYSQGRIAYLRGAFGEAKDCFEKILKEDHSDPDAAFQLGRVYRRLGDLRQAEKLFRQCQQSPGGGKWAEEIKKYLQENKS